jgi:hypothetical protein
MQRTILHATAVVAICLGLTHQANAELLVYEPFDYDDGTSLGGASGGVGFSGAWRDLTAGTTATIQPGNLTVPGLAPGLPAVGRSVLLSATASASLNIFRDFPEIAGADGTTTWISLVGQRLGEPTTDANPYGRGVNVGFFNTENTSRTERITVGNSSGAAENVWTILPTGRGGDIEQTTNPAVPYGGADPAWAVMRIDHRGAALDNETGQMAADLDDVYLWINPDPTVEPNIADANAMVLNGDDNAYDYSGLDFVRPFIGNTSGAGNFGILAVDELRIGTTFADMTAVPEPASVVMLLVAGLGLGVVRRR